MSKTTRHKLKATSLKTIEYLRLARGLDRKAHFAAGGTPADWRGTHDVRPDEAKEGDKYLCREGIADEEWDDGDDE
jgi:hypothetical protein